MAKPDSSSSKPRTLHDALNAALLAVGANAGTLMLVEEQNGKRVLKTRAHYGPPRDGSGHDREFQTNEKSARVRVLNSGISEIHSDVHKPDRRTPILKQNGRKPSFRSLLCVPIKRRKEVIGVINADHSSVGKFNEKDKLILEKHAAEIANLADELAVLGVLGQIAELLPITTSIQDLPSVLKCILEKLRPALGADLMTLYLYTPETETFHYEGDWPILAGEFDFPKLMHNEVRRGDWPYTIIESGEPIWRYDIEREDANRAPSDKVEGSFVHREKIKAAAAIPLLRPLGGQEKKAGVVGVMFVNHRRHHEFSKSEKAALLMVSRALAVAMGQMQDRRRFAHIHSGLVGRIRPDVYPLLEHDDKKSLRAALCEDEVPAFVLAMDIRRSTELMKEVRYPVLFAKFIHELESELRNAIIDEMGIVDKFTGDGILAFFPICYSGPGAGQRCLQAAERCHSVFERIYSDHKSSFETVLKETGLGVGIDYGMVTVSFHDGELILVGRPVVNACRLASGDAGSTAINNIAAYELLNYRSIKACEIPEPSQHATPILDISISGDFLRPIVRKIKHLGEIECFLATGLPGPRLTGLPKSLRENSGGDRIGLPK